MAVYLTFLALVVAVIIPKSHSLVMVSQFPVSMAHSVLVASDRYCKILFYPLGPNGDEYLFSPFNVTN